MRRALLVAAVLGGCLAPASDAPLVPEESAGRARLLDAGGVAVDVPVEVVLLGFDPGVAFALAEALAPFEIAQATKEDWRDVPPDASRGPHAPTYSDAYHALPMVPTALFRVRDGPVGLVDDVRASLPDANAAEDLLAAALAFPPERPGLVLLHLGETGHGWRYAYENGLLEPVRFFGERYPFLVLDVSAGPDPFVSDRDPIADAAYGALIGGSYVPPQAYDAPLARDASAVADLAALVRDAARHRVLQGSIYPPSLAPCHAVTAVLAVRAESPSETLPGYARAAELVDPARLERTWENLTGEDNVFVDLRILRLPLDDPVLDASTRASQGATGGVAGGHDALRWYVHENWDRYWVPHEGCEAYVSFVVAGPADVAAGGIAMYDAADGRRMSVSGASHDERLLGERTDGSAWDAFSLLFAHETGHLFGQNHPHNTFTVAGGRAEQRSFSAVWSAMSYETGDRTAHFGAVEQANFARNRAGYAVRAAADAGLADSPEMEAALAALAEGRWREATVTLRPLL